ncbi:MAG TPA: deoxyribose-phosphate aldolase [Rhodoglobus sp.]|jgi:deoxyribose-phosphate aldolase|nr:deoxyribose-phosphate aldolase [Rhodoglobus sp.]HOW00549.1 deoxyribose-phosphate aldolase [Rhodoglobus sp.]HOY80644.1 deoxyribose-phosphate aldolase [Rhodoglobus sp.]HPG74582.1 deoxyribose-phosphate aldolase [Rhodoglobus sp.]HPM51574.1 deoxyribose-phosphate aldolase [Rhodoglobus sp.]
MTDTTTVARHIQHTLIEADSTRDRMVDHARECIEWGFNAAMVPGSWVPVVAAELAGTGVLTASALDFPIVGTMTSAGKAAEAAELVRLGANQIDIGVQIGWLKSGLWDAFRDDIAGVVTAAGVPIKVMLELPLLTPEERRVAVELSIEAGAAYLKNASSGAVETANPASIAWLVKAAAGRALVKASGSIKSLDQVRSLLEAGADLVGTSAGIQIVSDSATAATSSY